MNEWLLLGSVKSIEDGVISLDTEVGTIKIGFNESFKERALTIQVGDKIVLKGKFEANKGIKLIAEKVVGFKRGA